MSGSVLLIVVDGPEDRRRFNECLSDTPHRLIYSFDGEDAFDRFIEAKPDLIIADEKAPRLDGPSLCQMIRHQGGQNVPFVILCGPSFPKERIEEVGADACVSREFERLELLDTLVPLLSRGRSPLFAPEALDESPGALASAFGSSNLDDDSLLVRAFDEGELLDPDTLDVEASSDAIPTSPTQELPELDLSYDILEEPIAPPGRREDLPEDDGPTNIVEMSGLFSLVDSGESTEGSPIPDPSELVLVSGVPDDDLFDEDSGVGLVAPVTDDLKTSQTTDTAKKRALIEEPMLPGPDDLGEFEDRTDTEEPPRRGTDSMIRELPREVTPTEERRAEDGDERAERRGRRGLSESQLGRRLQRRVRQMHAELDQLDYYQVLGVSRDASADAIKNAYFELSIEFHPDRYFLIRSGELKAKIYVIFRRIGEAHAVLSDPDRRADYDRGLDEGADKRVPEADRTSVPPEPRPEGFRIEAESKVPGAQQFIELARGAYDRGDRNGARLYLSFALVEDAGNATLEAALSGLVAQGAGIGAGSDLTGQNRDCA